MNKFTETTWDKRAQEIDRLLTEPDPCKLRQSIASLIEQREALRVLVREVEGWSNARREPEPYGTAEARLALGIIFNR